MEHRTPAEYRNTGRTLNSGTQEEQRKNVTTKHHHEILPIQNNNILNR